MPAQQWIRNRRNWPASFNAICAGRMAHGWRFCRVSPTYWQFIDFISNNCRSITSICMRWLDKDDRMANNTRLTSPNSRLYAAMLDIGSAASQNNIPLHAFVLHHSARLRSSECALAPERRCQHFSRNLNALSASHKAPVMIGRRCGVCSRNIGNKVLQLNSGYHNCDGCLYPTNNATTVMHRFTCCWPHCHRSHWAHALCSMSKLPQLFIHLCVCKYVFKCRVIWW